MEIVMSAIIDLNSELLVDRSRIRSPYLRLMLKAIGEELADGSPWIAVDKKLASQHGLLCLLIPPQRAFVAA
jgi:hypothetical protein